MIRLILLGTGSNPVGLFISGMVGSCASMTEQQKYWRDKVSQVLGWGTAALLVVAGWSLEHTDQFEIGPWADQIKPGTALNAIGLIAFALIFSIGWVRSLKWIYDNHLVNCTDSTILPRSAVDRYAKLVGSLLVVVALLLSLG